jgi:hypothetical protein
MQDLQFTKIVRILVAQRANPSSQDAGIGLASWCGNPVGSAMLVGDSWVGTLLVLVLLKKFRTFSFQSDRGSIAGFGGKLKRARQPCAAPGKVPASASVPFDPIPGSAGDSQLPPAFALPKPHRPLRKT